MLGWGRVAGGCWNLNKSNGTPKWPRFPASFSRHPRSRNCSERPCTGRRVPGEGHHARRTGSATRPGSTRTWPRSHSLPLGPDPCSSARPHTSVRQQHECHRAKGTRQRGCRSAGPSRPSTGLHNLGPSGGPCALWPLGDGSLTEARFPLHRRRSVDCPCTWSTRLGKVLQIPGVAVSPCVE